MTALITAALSYIGGDILVAILLRFGIGGAKATTVAAASKHAIPVLHAIRKKLEDKHKAAPDDQKPGYRAAIAELNGAQKSVVENWFN